MSEQGGAVPDAVPAEPAVPDYGPGTAAGDSRRGTGRYSVPEVARALGISERAVRKRITAGTLPAEKEGNQWVVFLPSGTGSAPEAVPGGTTEPSAVPEPPPGAVPGGTNLEPLAEVISDLTRENRQLAEAAAVWQFRALQAEEQLKALTAGSAETGPAQPQQGQEPRRGFFERLRGLFGGP